MAETQEIELYISDEGEVKVHIKGIKGPACLKALQALQKKVGIVQSKELTSEYYEKEKASDSAQNKIKNQ